MTLLCVQSCAGIPTQDLEATAPGEAEIYSQDGPKRGWKQFPSPNGAALGAGNLDPFSSPVVALTSPSAPAAHSKPGPQEHLGREFCREQEDAAPFSSGKKSAPVENISGNTGAQPRSVAQGLAGTQVWYTAVPCRVSVPTNSHMLWPAGKFSSFQSVWNVAGGAQTKGEVQTCVPSPPSCFQRSRGRDSSRSCPTTSAGAALVTCLCVPQPRRILFQEFV